MESGLAEFKERVRATWAAGNFDVLAQEIRDVGRAVVEAAEVGPGMTVLDVGCGTGNATISAALAGGKTTGLDLTPELLDDARRNAAAAGVEIKWVEGDAEKLPFDDDSFDAVLSTFGVMFAPRHEVAAGELARVCAPGGVIVLASWTPDGLIGQTFKLTAPRLPPPPPFASVPVLWGNAGHVLDLFGPHGVDARFEKRTKVWTDQTVEAIVRRLEENLGPWKMLRGAVGEEEWPEVREQLKTLYEAANRAPEGQPAECVAEYLLTVARKPIGS